MELLVYNEYMDGWQKLVDEIRWELSENDYEIIK